MPRLIDADALMKAMYHRAFETDGDTMWQSGCWVRYRAIEQVIKEQPTAKPVRKTAEWIYGEKDGADGWYCSMCRFHIPWYYDYYGLKNINFIRDFYTCPHCDSKMVKYTGMERDQDWLHRWEEERESE